ncbi:Lon protease, bacterial/eukaryotic-type,ATPase, AAA-type, core,Lon, substrate-binding domain,Peptidase [Cinara cedri]|uniref:Lon protease homolog n=1 Tax=Cinara cedri TaxID=506608 RepID=A0A5E4NTQ4_9HEMI|nr:Lon protease, bacterial/eukaryotic-type,ATPase, AAA-type, core,Lon, substrate-binding domain,Peptidase [Cinara cedri]
MNVPSEIPIVFTTPILIPGFILKIRLQVKENFNLLEYLLKDYGVNSIPKHMVGIIPSLDFEKVGCIIDDVIGTIGLVQKVIKTGLVPEEFYIVVRGICRFKLKEAITEEPFKIHKIEAIANFKKLIGEEDKKAELITVFEKVFVDWMAYYEASVLDPFIMANPKSILKEFSLCDIVDICLRNIVPLNQKVTYQILRATDLNQILIIIIEVLKLENMAHRGSKFGKSGLLPFPPTLFNTLISSFELNKSNAKKPLSCELQEIETKLKEEDMPKSVYDLILNEFNRLKLINTISPEYTIILNYVSYVVNLPWNKSTKETLDLEKTKNVLELNHYGMDKVKKRIIQFIAVRILNPEIRSPILCLIGPPGVGKTTIAKTIANSLNRTFKRISLGGINHYSDIKGHRKTYVGSMPGCIIQAINQYNGSGGDPAAALLEVLDIEQNDSFIDSYINVPFDLSQVIFISTANNAAGIPQTLRDRMELVYLEGYTSDAKMQIAENYLIPKIFKDHRMNDKQISITTNAVKDIIQKYTSEAGVRDLQRKLGIICHYIAVKIVENTAEEPTNYVITPKSLLTIFNDENIYDTKSYLVEKSINKIGVAIGLAWTPVGGQIQVIETSKTYSKSINDLLIITGQAGRTLKESIKIAVSWIQSFAKKNKFNIDNICVHVHLPEGSIKKDGPSAGMSIVCAIISLIWNTPLRPLIAMTGEISLQGFVLPVGGIKEKVLAAYDSGIKTIIIPALNMNDTVGLPKKMNDDLNIVPVNHLEEVLEIVITGGLKYLKNPTDGEKIPSSKL